MNDVGQVFAQGHEVGQSVTLKTRVAVPESP